MESGEGGGKAFVIASEATEARGPSKGAFDDPAMREKHEAVFGLGELDHFEADALFGSQSGARFASVTFINISNFDRFIKADRQGESRAPHGARS